MPESASLETFDRTKSNQYILSIRLSTDGFSFSVFDPDCDCFVCFHPVQLCTALSYAENVKRAFKELAFLSYTYKQVSVLIVSKRFTMIPLELFEEEYTQTLFYYNYSPKEYETVDKNILANSSCVVLYGMDKSVRDFLTNRFPESDFFSQIAVLTEHFSVESRSARLKQMFVYLRQNCVDLYCFDRGIVSLINSYECSCVADFSYYILFVWKQLGMDQEKDELYLTGDLPEKSELFEMLSEFVRKVSEPELEIDSNQIAGVYEGNVPYDIQVLMSKKGKV